MFRRQRLSLWLKNPHAGPMYHPEAWTAYRSERSMLKLRRAPIWEQTTHTRMKEVWRFNPSAVPRDLGEIPREYMLRHLYFQQPTTSQQFWEELKKNPDIPFDSKKHLTLVLKMARIEGWVTFEKDQEANKFTLSVSREKYGEVQELVRAHREAERRQAETDAERELEAARADEAATAERSNEYVEWMHAELVRASERLKMYDPAAFEELPMREAKTGKGHAGYDMFWYRADTPAAATDDKANTNPQHTDADGGAPATA
eukprot:PhM_4_TR4874/c0_g1_i1/m.4843